MKEIFKNVREKLVAKYLKNNISTAYSKNTKKFKPRIKARIRKNKQLISKNIDTFFDWIKGAELIELKSCNVKEDPVRPELDNKLLESREGIHWIHELEENFLLSIHSEFLSVKQDNNSFKKSIQDHVEKVLKKSIIISNVEPVIDANGKTITYLVWMKQR